MKCFETQMVITPFICHLASHIQQLQEMCSSAASSVHKSKLMAQKGEWLVGYDLFSDEKFHFYFFSSGKAYYKIQGGSLKIHYYTLTYVKIKVIQQ